jgi:type I protein arginine methyltransferase
MPITRVPTAYAGGRVTVAVCDQTEVGAGASLWPAVGEYPLYDAFLYYMMTNDLVRNEAFGTALRAVAAGRTVLDIGTGQDLYWAREAVRAGAARVVALEAMAKSHAVAAKQLATVPEADRIELIHGSSYDVELPQRAQVCVAELIGSIASAEGMLAALADARTRLLARDCVVVPAACATMVGAMSLRSLLPDGLAFSHLSVPYLRQIFDTCGRAFDVRLSVANPDPACVVSTTEAVETLRFDGTEQLDATTHVQLQIVRAGQVDGLLCWIRLEAGAGARVVDSLTDKTSWIPGYLPLFDEPVPVCAGDVVEVEFRRETSDDRVHPDYAVRAALTTAAGVVTGGSVSTHHGRDLGLTAIHRELLGITGN